MPDHEAVDDPSPRKVEMDKIVLLLQKKIQKLKESERSELYSINSNDQASLGRKLSWRLSTWNSPAVSERLRPKDIVHDECVLQKLQSLTPCDLCSPRSREDIALHDPGCIFEV